MGLFDKVKNLAGQHADKVEGAIDKAADMVDERTGGKYAEHIDKGAEAAKGFVDGDGEHVAVDGDGAPLAADRLPGEGGLPPEPPRV